MPAAAAMTSQLAPAQHQTMFMCPDQYEGGSYLAELSAAKPDWVALPKTSFNLRDLPETMNGVTQLVWTISAVPSHTGLRDGEQNTAHAIVAGWFLAQQLRAFGHDASRTEGMDELRRHLFVLRAAHAAPIVDVGPFEQVFKGIDQYVELLARVPSTPTSKRKLPEHFVRGKERLRTFLITGLSTSQVPQLAQEIGGETLRLEVLGHQDKAGQVSNLLTHLFPETIERWFRFLPQHFPGSARELEELAAQLHGDVLQRTPGVARLAPERPPLERYVGGTTLGDILSLAYQLDRKQQWGQLLDECGQHRHGVFLLRSDSRQGLGLFLDRMRIFLETRAVELSVATVAFRQGFHYAESAAEWRRRLALALGRGEPGQAHEHLRARAEMASPFIILGMQPFRELSSHQKTGLREFLLESYPHCVRSAAPGHPVRLFLSVDGDEYGSDLADSIDLWAGLGTQYYNSKLREPGIDNQPLLEMQYVPLAPVSFPSWEEVRDYLDSLQVGPALAVRRRIREDHERLMNHEQASFQDLVQLLHRHVGPF